MREPLPGNVECTTEDRIGSPGTLMIPPSNKLGSVHVGVLGDSLQWLIENDFISAETAHAAAPNPEELKMRLKGIHQTAGRIVG